MNVDVAKSVYKDAEKYPKYIRDLVDEQIEILEKAEKLSDVSNVFKMQ